MTEKILESLMRNLLEGLSDEHRDQLAANLGEVVLEASVLRAMSEISQEQSVALEYYLRTEPEADDLFLYLVRRCRGFADIFDEEVANIQKDIEGVLTAA